MISNYFRVLNIKFNKEINSNVKITITNALGEVIQQTEYSKISNENLKFNLFNLQNGIYFITVESYYGISTKKLMFYK